MKRSLFYSLLLLCCLSLLLCCGCGRQEIQQNQELIDLQTYQPETVYIGATLPLSGEHSSLGQDSRAAMEVAVDIINNSHELDWDLARGKGITGFGNAQVELVFSDCESNEILTADAADALLNQGVVAMVGAGRSEYTAEVGKRCRMADVALVSGASNSSALTDGATYTFGKWFNRIAPNPEMESATFFSYIKHLNQTQNAGIKTIGVAYQDTVHSLRTLEVFYEQAKLAGLEVLVSVAYGSKPENVTLETSRIVTAAPDVMAHIGGSELSAFLQGYAAAQYKPKLMLCYFGGYEDSSLAETAQSLGISYLAGLSITPPREGDVQAAQAELNKEPSIQLPSGNSSSGNSSAAGSSGSSSSTGSSGSSSPTGSPGSPTANSSQVNHQLVNTEEYNEIFSYIEKLYQARTGKRMSDEALLEFSSVIVLAQAIGKCGTTDREVLQQVLKENSFDAPYLYSGSIAFDEKGQNTVMSGYLTTITQDGHYLQIFKQ
ncbi:MAG: ABC transporter substrate-binding protein [Firmicutes bacterium]|nr:ABC transporter substrate-binding protein [Bacillota bacterium]